MVLLVCLAVTMRVVCSVYLGECSSEKKLLSASPAHHALFAYRGRAREFVIWYRAS